MELKTSFTRLLGKDGLEYVREQLSKGGPLSRELINSLDGGFAWEFVLADMPSSQQPGGYLVGGALDAEQASTLWSIYADFLREFAMSNPSRVLLFEDQFFKMSDPCLTATESLFEWNGVTYHYLPYRGTTLSSATIEEAITMSSDYPRIVLAIERPVTLPSRSGLASNLANELVQGIKHVVVGAYDGEGFIAWSRGTSQEELHRLTVEKI
jgi:hypothetical protein